jgi:segregation and condensation protein A
VLNLSARELNSEQNWLNLEQLVELWTQTKLLKQNGSGHESKHSHLVSVFWALLLLSAQSKVELFQEEFYHEIKIRLLTDSAKTSKPFEQSMN